MSGLSFAAVLLGAVIVLLWGQAFRLQIVQGADHIRRAEQNRFAIVSLPAPRGLFYDVSGQELVTGQPGRTYRYPEEFAHVLGYLGEASASELTLFGVELGEWVGKQGLERVEDGRLRGSPGGVVQEVGASRELIRTLSRREPIAGRSIQLSLSLALQQTAYALLKKSAHPGAIIAGTADGTLLALASYPSFDPNIFMTSLNQDEATSAHTSIEGLLTDEAKPLFHRAIAGLYPPASTFKIVTTIAALEDGAISAQTQIEDTGQVTVGKFRFGNWFFDQYGRTEGSLTVVQALKRSNDIYFYKTGEKVGIDALSEWARILGFGQTTGLSLEGEEAGLVPDREWKERARGEPWFLGDTYITAIGQGNLQATPLQVHQLMSLVASRGYRCTPHVVLTPVDAQPTQPWQATGLSWKQCTKVDILPRNLDVVVEGLQQACQPGGTGWPLFNFRVPITTINSNHPLDGVNYIQDASASAQSAYIPVACKTGTAETGRKQVKDNKEVQLTHAWFTAFAPVKKPEIIVTVLLEDAGQGSDQAAPLAKEMLKAWFASTIRP